MITFASELGKNDEDGMRYVRAQKDDGKKVFIQLNHVTVTSSENGTVTLDLSGKHGPVNAKKIADVDEVTLRAAQENSNAWFGKALSQATITSTYTPSSVEDTLEVDRIPHTRVFSGNLEPASFGEIQEGTKLNVIVEFGGCWFARKSFGGVWNLVQAKIHTPPPPPPPEYPEDYAMDDDEPEAVEPTPAVEPEPEPEAIPDPEPESTADPEAEA